MKKVAFAVALIFAFGVGVASADIWKNIGRTVGKAWEDVKRETTNVAHNSEKTIGKAWEDIKRETTNALKNVTFSSNYNREINGDGNVKTEFKVNL